VLWLSPRSRRAASRRSSSCSRALGRQAPSRRPLFETLELRQMLANYTWNDAANTLAISLSNNESLTVSETGGNVAFTLSTGTFTQSGGNTAPGNGTNAITLAAADLTSSVTINNSTVVAGTNSVTFSGAGSLSSANIAVNLTDADAVGAISTTGGFDLTSTGAGGITLEAQRNISIAASTAISTTSGNVTLRANQGATPASGNFVGIDLNGATVSSTGSGDLLFEGRGGNVGGFKHGILVQNGSKVESIATGTIAFNGNGGNGTSEGNFGVWITDANTNITSVNGAIQITGKGGDSAVSSNGGIFVGDGAIVESTGASDGATITLDGTGGTSTHHSLGVWLSGVNTKVTSISGAIDILGHGGTGTVATAYGFYISGGALVESTGIVDGATITIEGTGGTATYGNYGIWLSANSKVTSVSGAIELIGQGGQGASSPGILADFSGFTIASTGTANITLTSDEIELDPNVSVNAGANTVTLKTKTTDGTVEINLGESDDSSLGLSDAELDRITAGKIIIGDAATPNTITVSDAIEHAGDADFEVLTARNIVFESGSSWTTQDGDLSFTANRQSIATTGDFVGVALAGASLTTSGSGQILLKGRGGNAELYSYGISVLSGSIIQSTSALSGAGTIDIDGRGGSGSFFNVGVIIGGTDTEITSIVGNITITGRGGDGAGSANYGVGIGNQAVVSSTGTGVNAAKISVEGTGGLGSSTCFGTFISEFGQINSVDGDIAITGFGGGTASSDSNTGVFFFNSSTVSSTGTASIEVFGTGGLGVGSNFGVNFNGGAPGMTSVDGAIEITAIAGGNTDSALNVGSSSNINSTGSATIVLIADSIRFANNSAINAAGNTVTIQPKTEARSINLGGADSATELGLTDAELDRITAGKIVIGDSTSGNIVVTANITRAAATNIELVSGRDVIITGGQVNTGGGTLLLHPGTSPDVVKPTKAGIDATASTVSFASDLAIAINGTTVDTGYTQLNVAGTVDLTGVKLVISGSYKPKFGDVFTIVRATNIVGQFDHLAEGTRVLFNGVPLRVEYSATTVTLSAPQRGPEDLIVLGTDAGAPPRVIVFDTHGVLIASFLVYGDGFRGGVRVALADLNRDGIAEIIVAPGAGMPAVVSVFDLNGKELRDYRTKAYEGFSGGVFVAAGDVNGDGRVDIITSPGEGLSNVKVFKNRVGIASTNSDPISNKPIYSFLAFDTFTRRGATVAAGDLTGDGKAEIVVGNGVGASPLVRVFDPTTLSGTAQLQFATPMLELRPFKSTDRGGVFVAVGNVRGDATPEIIIGNGANGRGRVEMYSATGSRFKSFSAYDDKSRNAPVHVTTKNIDKDALDEIITGQGAFGGHSRLRSFNSDGTRADEVFEGSDDLLYDFGFFVA
jgi:hypothetical protein